MGNVGFDVPSDRKGVNQMSNTSERSDAPAPARAKRRGSTIRGATRENTDRTRRVWSPVSREKAEAALCGLGVELPKHGSVVIKVLGPNVFVERRAWRKQHSERLERMRAHITAAVEHRHSRYLSTTEAARHLGVSSETVRRWCANGWIPVARVGGRWKIPVSALAAGNRFMAEMHGLTDGRLRGTEYDGDPEYGNDP